MQSPKFLENLEVFYRQRFFIDFKSHTSYCLRQVIYIIPIIQTVGFSGDSDGKESACSAGELGLIPLLGRSPGEGKGYPVQYSGLENFMDSPCMSDFHFQLQLQQRQTVRGLGRRLLLLLNKCFLPFTILLGIKT